MKDLSSEQESRETAMSGDSAYAVAEQMATVSSESYKYAMRRVVSPVAVITANADGERNGLTATAVCSATTEPPTILICIQRDAKAIGLIERSRTFAVNFLNDTQSDVARAFSTRQLAGEARLKTGSWKTMATGAPVLESAISVFDCELDRSIACGSHEILFGRVVAVTSGEDSALLYRDGFFRRVAPE